MSSVDLPSTPAPRRPWWSIAAIVAIAFALALAGAVALNAGARLQGSPSTVVVPAAEMTIARGQGGRAGAALALEALDAGGDGLIAAPGRSIDADAYSRITWRFAVDPAGGIGLAMTWVRRDRPGTVYTAPIDWTRGDATIDLTRHPDWAGTVAGIGLAVRGRLAAPLVVAEANLRSNAWDTTVFDIVDAWWGGQPDAAATSLRRESVQIAPMLSVVAAAVALAVGFVVWRDRRRRLAPDLGAVIAIVLAGWLALDLRWQRVLWQQHAAAWNAYAGRTLDEKHAAARDAAIFAVARRIRDAERPRGARVLVLSDSWPLAARVAWFLYPDNVWVDMRRMLRGTPPAPDTLRRGDQVVLLLKRGIAWDAASERLVWTDGRTRDARAIMVDGPELALVEIR